MLKALHSTAPTQEGSHSSSSKHGLRDLPCSTLRGGLLLTIHRLQLLRHALKSVVHISRPVRSWLHTEVQLE
jgi:hypothetical protein